MLMKFSEIEPPGRKRHERRSNRADNEEDLEIA
jgi:hypothetical protein